MKDIPSIIVQGYRLTKNLATSQVRVILNITTNNEVEHDIDRCYADGDKIVVIFGQVKIVMVKVKKWKHLSISTFHI